MSGFFVLLLLPRLHSVGASGKSANDGGAGGLEMHYRSEPACFQDFSTAARRPSLWTAAPWHGPGKPEFP